MILAKLGINTSPSAIQIFHVPLSISDTTTSANSILGNEARQSFTLINISSTIPPKYPVSAPITVPITAPMVTVNNEIPKVVAAPFITRVKMSRP